jgi:hypothetical protein
MVTHLHEKFYRSNATPLSEADIKEIRESRGRIPNASKIMAKKFHVGARRIYEIWNNSERLQQGLILSSSDQPALDKNPQSDKSEQTLEAVSSISLPATEIPKKNSRKKKVKIDEKPVTEVTSMVEKNNKNCMVSSYDNSSDTSREDRAESFLKNLINRGEKLKGLTANTPFA